MSSGGAGSRVSIPNNVRQTIHHIREITGKQHTDEDIYTVLKECSMDPNETTQKLLFLDTFHVVQRKPRRKENSNSRAPEDSRMSTSTQGRGARGNRGNYSSHYISSDAGAGRNSAPRRVNGVGYRTERGPTSSSSSILEKTKNDAAPHVTKSTIATPNGPTNLSNGSSSPTHGPPSASVIIDVLEDGSTDANKDTAAPVCSVVAEQLPSKNIPTFGSVIGVDLAKSATNSDQLPSSGSPSAPTVYSSPSDPVLVPTLISRHPSAVGSQWVVAEPNHNEVGSHLPHIVADSDLSKIENVASVANRKVPSKLKAVEKVQLSEPPQSSSLAIHDGPSAVRSSIYDGQSPQETIGPSTVVVEPELASVNAESSSQSVPYSNVSEGHHVTFPHHFQVPEALRNGLTFGSFDPGFGPSIKSNGPAGDISSTVGVESSQRSDDTATENPSINHSVTSIAHEGDYPDHVQPTPDVLEKGPSEGNVASSVLTQYDQMKQDILMPSESSQNPAIQNAANYSLGLMPPMLGSQHIQFEAPEPQGGNSPVVSGPSPSPSPPVTQSAGMAQNSVPVSPHPFPLFRQPYPPNYFPYGPYFSPFFVPPMHQFIGPNGFPQQPSAGNVYLPPAAAAGVKYSVPQFKAGPNPVNPIGFPPAYGSYSSSHVGYGPSPAVSTGSSTGGEDHPASQLKENHVYTTGQLSEGSAVWFSAPSQDISCLPVSSLYSLPPTQGQHVAYSPMQAGHGAYAGMYQPSQTIAAPSAVLPLMQQSQAMVGGVENAGPQSGVYQQPQHAQMNWNTNF